MMKSRRHPSWARQRGTALIEFALVLPLLLVLTILVIDFSMAFMTKNLVTQAAREGARKAIVTGGDQDSVTAVVKLVTGAAGLSPASVTAVVTQVGNDQVRVSVSAPFHWIDPGLLYWMGVQTTGIDTLRASCTMALELSNP